MAIAKAKKESTKSTAKTTKAKTTREPASKKGLVVVESPAKAKTLKKYLGSGFDVKASVGHIRDLPKSKLGVDVDKGFEPTYELIKGKQKVIDDLTAAAKRADKVYLAADPDREGEAIAWHVAEVLDLPKNKIYRVLFHEITKPAVLKAIENPVELNQDRVESQQARRILDRLVGYKISPILWVKVRRGLSAGRVQSVAVRMITEREKEITVFVPQAYWSITATLVGEQKEFSARLVRVGEKKIDRLDINTAEWAQEIVDRSTTAQWKIQSIQLKQRRRNPYAPFITSTLQQEASKRLYFSAKKTMTLAQQLYEGIEIGDAGAQGLITYMRTDSTRLSDQSIKDARELIEKNFGNEYLPKAPLEYRNKKNAQDAHEAIRPTSVEYEPKKVKEYLDADQFKLYELIWKRYLACQMEQAIFDQTTIELEVKPTSGDTYGFRASGSILRFDGFLVLWKDDEASEDDEARLPDLKETSSVSCQKVISEKHMTQPPPRFSESSLIKELEEKGIGRPSTYAAILSTIQDRKYVEKRENRFYPTELGVIVTDLLIENFANIVDAEFTANMEEELDKIEEGSRDWVKALEAFYVPFKNTLKVAEEKMRNLKKEETPTNLTCQKCTKPLVIKWGRNGKFVACQGYPECRFTSEFTTETDGTIKLQEQITTDEKCPNCTAPMAVKSGRFGKFLACSKYPECKTTKPITTGIACPECKEGELSQKRTRFGKIFFSCTKYPNCKYAIWDKPLKQPCPQCQSPFILEHYTKKEGASLRCPNKDCGWTIAKPETENTAPMSPA